MRVQYLEIVSADAEGACAGYAAACGLRFGDGVAALGGARVAELSDGSWLGVRAPLRESEQPVVRPYWLVEDIDAALARAQSAGAVVALSRTLIRGFGACAIYLLGGNEFGLWEKVR